MVKSEHLKQIPESPSLSYKMPHYKLLCYKRNKPLFCAKPLRYVTIEPGPPPKNFFKEGLATPYDLVKGRQLRHEQDMGMMGLSSEARWKLWAAREEFRTGQFLGSPERCTSHVHRQFSRSNYATHPLCRRRRLLGCNSWIPRAGFHNVCIHSDMCDAPVLGRIIMTVYKSFIITQYI